ncbi:MULTISPECIES: glycoside hydrolase family 20 zincin-like fold domain-containing protein [Streptomyces]|uniref:glycoside hydrolase family 20 zincin-like fold domain-containing protein n=1 Tax=Streptomyces TaxID=1883 RepID=UPI0004C1DF12|nr:MULTISPECIES: glycoside hydrolase family 20 zincin-like fold domain-containing protein [Streptomyces]
MDLIPAPSSAVRRPDEDFPLDAATTLTAAPALADAERWLRTTLSAATGLPLGPGRPGAGIELVQDDALAAEAYRITVRPGRALLAAGGPAGALWGAQTLRQLLGPDAYRRSPLRREGWVLPGADIEGPPPVR